MFGYIFDDTVLAALGAGGHGPGALLAALDDRDTRVCVPAVTLAYAFARIEHDHAAELLGIIEAIPNAAVEPVADTVAALELAEVLALIPDDAAAAHALLAARVQDMEIITLDRARWEPVQERLSYQVPLVVLADE